MADAASQRETFSIDALHPALAGHFPGNPVVPGVVLLERVLDAAQRRFGMRADALRLPQVKFLQPLLPGQMAEIMFDTVGFDNVGLAKVGADGITLEDMATDVNPAPDRRIRFRIERDGALLASGEMVAPAAVAAASNATDAA
jgi:hypothetical protein